MKQREVIQILIAEGFDFAEEWIVQTNQLQRVIGEDYINAKHPGSGTDIEYTQEDVRRAVLHLRLRAVLGSPNSYRAQKIFRDVKNIAAHHEDGYITHDGENVYWTRHLGDDHTALLVEGGGFVIIPCWIESLNKGNIGTVPLETEEAQVR